MKTLLYKQLRLVCQPMTLVFCLFGVMLLIPAYPYTVMWFYVMLGLFFSFLNGREQKDVYYSALLSFYRTAYKVGVSFVKACIVMAVAAIIMEAAVHFPALSRFNGYDLACQLPLLAAGLVIWCGSWPLIFRGAAARYEKVDL